MAGTQLHKSKKGVGGGPSMGRMPGNGLCGESVPAIMLHRGISLSCGFLGISIYESEKYMNRKSIALLSVAVGLGFAGWVIADDMSGMKTDSPSPTTQPAVADAAQPTTRPFQVEDVRNTICPVSGDKVEDSKLIEVYNGKAYHLCCPDCHTAFENHPEKFAAAVAANPAKYGIK